MIESAAYDIIKQEGFREGIQNGIQEMLLDAIEARFEKIPDDILSIVNRISDRNLLKSFHKQAITCADLDALRSVLNQAKQ